MKRRVMLYLSDEDFSRLSSLAKKTDTSMNAVTVSLLWQADMPRRKAGEVLEYVCKRCGRRVFTDIAEALEPDTCPYPGCGGALVSAGRCFTLVLGRIE